MMMKKASSVSVVFFITILFSSGLLPELVNSQTDSCSSNLNIDGLPFDSTSLNCIPVWAPYDFILRYRQASPNQWSFVLSAPAANSYVAMGFSSNGMMVGSSAIVGWMSSDQTGTIKQYFLGGQTPRQVTPDQGNLNITSSMVISQSSRLYLIFQLNTNQPQSRLIYSVGPDRVLPSAAAGFTLTEHRDMVTTRLNYVTGETQTQSTPHAQLRRSHGVLNMLGWGILMIIGAMVARYMKQWDPIWFYSHTLIQSLGFLLGLSGVITGLVLNNKLDADVSTHKSLGILILVLGCLQVLAFLARPDKESKVRKYWNWYHYMVGRILIIFAISNVFYGIHLGEKGTEWRAGYAVVVAFLFFIAIILEIRMWMRK
ncbi:hypothetical protein ACOSP7_003000 [Xanthoceras sorbifolium]|uniref:Cytochrome b561 and DOMON domain-containing protein n=1 Tax=Xanthoceras sorbifolium TaxID=99658 RepID=A0ABQ8IK69_9ROSI|nr:hypothetical protein JRO89_XS01G0111100 [Xanthoceras sorbifolium]